MLRQSLSKLVKRLKFYKKKCFNNFNLAPLQQYLNYTNINKVKVL